MGSHLRTGHAWFKNCSAIKLRPLLPLVKIYLSSYCTVGLPWRRWLKDPLLLLWGQCGIQWNDFNVSNFRSKVIDLSLDPFTGLINFLKAES